MKKNNTKSKKNLKTTFSNFLANKNSGKLIIAISGLLIFIIIFIVAAIGLPKKEPGTDPNDLDTVAQAAADAAQKEYVSRDKIFEITPFRNYKSGYYIDATWNGEDKPITITISLLSCNSTYREEAKPRALNWLKNHSLTLSSYEIIYKNKCD